MGREWEIKDVGKNKYFLGMRMQQDLDVGMIRLTQCPYWEHIINRFDLAHVTPRNVPLPVGLILENNMSPKTDSEKQQMLDKQYRPILGSIMWGNSLLDLTYPSQSHYCYGSRQTLGSSIGMPSCMLLGTSRTLSTTV